MNIPVVREHFQRAIVLLDALNKANHAKTDDEVTKSFMLVGMLATMTAHMDYGTRSLDRFFKNKEDEKYPDDLIDHLYGLNKGIKLAVNGINRGIMSHVAMSDMPAGYHRRQGIDVRTEDIKRISMVNDQLKLVVLDLEMMM